MNFFLKRGDTSPAIRFALTPDVDLTGATVVFTMVGPGLSGSTVVDREAAAIVQANPGIVQYDWQAGDTSTAGKFFAEFEVTYADNTVETYPNIDHITVRIFEDLG